MTQPFTKVDMQYELVLAAIRLEAASHPTDLKPRPTSERQQVDQATVTAQGSSEASRMDGHWMGSQQHGGTK